MAAPGGAANVDVPAAAAAAVPLDEEWVKALDARVEELKKDRPQVAAPLAELRAHYIRSSCRLSHVWPLAWELAKK